MRLAGGQTSKNDVCARIRECVGIYIYIQRGGGEGGRRRCAGLYKIIGVASRLCAKDELLHPRRLRARVCRADAL